MQIASRNQAFMKKLIVSILAFLLFSIGAYAQCFTPVWTDPSRNPMFIYVSMATLDGTNLQIGDEVGVFDEEECVGIGVLEEELTGAPIYLVIETSREHRRNGGFRRGNTITYQFCFGGVIANSDVIPNYISNGPTFNSNDSCVVELRAGNTPPTITSIPDTVAFEDEQYSSSITAVDYDGDSLIYTSPVLPSWLNFNDTTHILSGTPENDHVGENRVTLTINDGTVDAVQSFVIRVENVNDPPVVTSVPVTEASPGTAYSYTILVEDVDGDTLIYKALVLPGWLSFNPSTHTLSATPGEDDIGDQHVKIRVSDGLLHADHTFIITVSLGNHAPTFTSNPVTSVVVGDSCVYTITAQDIDGDTLSYSAPLLPDWLTFDPATHAISGVPRSSDLGYHDATVRVSDGTVSADQSFPITVQNANITPAFTSTPVTSVTIDELYIYFATAEDADGDDLVFNASVLPDWLSFEVNEQVLHGTPGNQDVGEHHVSLIVSDGEGTEIQSFILTVGVQSGAGIHDFGSTDFMVIYPNPSDGRVIIELSRELENEVILEILDAMGKVLMQQKFPPSFLIKEEYNMSDRSAGIYYIKVYNDSHQTIRKLMIH